MTDTDKKDIEALKLQTQKKQLIENLLTEHGNILMNGLRKMHLNEMLNQVLHLQNVVMPAIEKKVGRDHDQFVFYKSVCDSILSGIYFHDRASFWKREYEYQRSATEFFRADSIRMREELQRYHFAEDAILDDQSFNRLKQAVLERMANPDDLIT